MRASIPNPEQLSVSNLDPTIPKDRWETWLQDVAALVEERIARDFERERGAGKALGAISDEHEQRKARDGLELERGHMTGDLQAELDAGGFASVVVVSSRGDIRFDQEKLYARAPHARYYAEDKVQGGKILTFLRKDATAAEAYLKARVSEWQRGKSTRESADRQRSPGVARIASRITRRALGALFRV